MASVSASNNNNKQPFHHPIKDKNGQSRPQLQLDAQSKSSVRSKDGSHGAPSQTANLASRVYITQLNPPLSQSPYYPTSTSTVSNNSNQSRSKSLKSFYISATNRSISSAKSSIGFDRSRSLRVQIERAIRDRKVYTLIGIFPGIRRSLNRRGWVEKSSSMAPIKFLHHSLLELEQRGYEDESDQAWVHRVLRDYPPDFIWVFRRDNINFHNLLPNQIVNRHPKAFFTSKVGITSCLQNLHWFCENGIANTFFPRCYRLCINEEKNAFINDYRLTACMGLLKWVVGAYERDGDKGVMDYNASNNRISSLCVEFAIRQVNNYVRLRRHEDIDWLIQPSYLGLNWDLFLTQYYSVVLMKTKLSPQDMTDTAKSKYETTKRTLQKVAPFWPQLNIDGTNNVWICKPGARSRGSGIVLMNTLERIMSLLGQSGARESNWVVQKYIERPLLIYQTKFDIRQWFIVSDWCPLTVWFYKESYVRFCTKPFSIDDFHESIHLCNNAIQSRYQNSDKRDAALPAENMWDNYTFQAYLKSIGKMELWDKQIYPGMKQGILGVLLASQETADFRKNCFELYGADFMLSDDFIPWLIEINSSPCMASTTSVTARMCGRCLEDCIKVIVDRRDNKSAETGMFELIYKQNDSSMPFHMYPEVQDVQIHVKRLTKDVDWPRLHNDEIQQQAQSKRLRLKDAQKNSPLNTAPKTSNNSLESVASTVPASMTNNSFYRQSAKPATTVKDSASLVQNRVLKPRRKSQSKSQHQNFERPKSVGNDSVIRKQKKPKAALEEERNGLGSANATAISQGPRETNVSKDHGSVRRSASADSRVNITSQSDDTNSQKNVNNMDVIGEDTDPK
ncbi:unnamed protein product [Allacma fusca]|uniref:Tubulin glycylase 3A n=1 Tax=Allacma fusca TaxID=39272 RepID=A0A8J2PHE4_9HEXA|nr:unnamed protein product [Allacma fusca]